MGGSAIRSRTCVAEHVGMGGDLLPGLLLKRLMGKCGLLVANTLQAVLFGLMHGVPLFLMTGMSVVQAAVITLFTGLAGWCMGYMNEKHAQGSIFPSWTVHMLSNVASGTLSAFNML